MIWSGLSGVEGPGKERPVSNSKGVKPGILLTEERTDINTNGRTESMSFTVSGLGCDKMLSR